MNDRVELGAERQRAFLTSIETGGLDSVDILTISWEGFLRKMVCWSKGEDVGLLGDAGLLILSGVCLGDYFVRLFLPSDRQGPGW